MPTSILKVPAQAFIKMKRCEKHKCDGFMKTQGYSMLTSCPPQFLHKCDKCGEEEIITGQYPEVVIEQIPD